MTSSAALSPTLIETDAVPAVVVRGKVPMAELRDFFDRSFGQIERACAEQGIIPTGAAFARYHGAPTEIVDLEVGLPTGSPVRAAGGVEAGLLPAGRVVTATHIGGYEGLGAAWGQVGDWLGQQGLTPTETLWEVYVTEPAPDVDPDTMRTDVFWMVAD
ncbi:MAG: GyrI-like domain-containing protein [Propionibacteriaceae bacterium]